MKDFEGKFINILFICFVVLVLLLSNIGENFKNDVFSAYDANKQFDKLRLIWNTSKDHQEYVSRTSNFIVNYFSNYNLKPINNSFIHVWNEKMPKSINSSILEVTTEYGKTIKKYEYGSDFYEDFKGYYINGHIYDYFQLASNLNEDFDSSIVLTDLYNYGNVKDIDNFFIDQNVKAVISPAFSNDLMLSSGLLDDSIDFYKKGLIKIIVKQNIFSDLVRYSNKGYKIRISAGKILETSEYKNVYGVLPGKNKLYKPLVIVSFFDNGLKLPEFKNTLFTVTTPSILLETISSIKNQRASRPDRTIIFAFLSGYVMNNKAIEILYKDIPNAEILILDSFGNDYNVTIRHSAKSEGFAKAVQKFLEENKFYVASTVIDEDILDNTVFLSSLNYNTIVSQYVDNSGDFILSFIEDECFNLDILSANIRTLRSVKKFIKNNSIIISLLTLVYLVYVLFKPKKIVDK